MKKHSGMRPQDITELPYTKTILIFVLQMKAGMNRFAKKQSLVSGKIFLKRLNMTFCKVFSNISPLQGLFLKFFTHSTNIWAALPLK